MCREDDGQDSDLIQSDLTFDIDFENFKFEDHIYGLDRYTGFCMIQFSLEEGLRLGYLEGSPFYNPDDPIRLSTGPGNYPLVKLCPVGEPGMKCRVITVAEDWVTQLLSPFGHEIVSSLKEIPSARDGLSAANQLYAWVKRANARSGLDDEDLWFLSSDLTQASEYLEHEVSRTILKSYMKGAGLESAYTDICIDLLTSPRIIGEAEDNTGLSHEYLGLATRRGSLMGDPGTKGCLTLTMLVAEQTAYIKYLAEIEKVDVLEVLNKNLPDNIWRLFSNAGDDHIAIGPRRYLELLGEELTRLGAEVSIEKSYLSRIGAYYTEELLLRTKNSRFNHRCPDGKIIPIWKVPYNETYHIDAMKVRLLSRCSKITSVRNEKNPALGKSKMFLKKISWLPRSFDPFKDLAIERFKRRFAGLLKFDNLMTYLPRFLGGLGFPSPKDWGQPEKLEAFLRLPRTVQTAICSVLDGTASKDISKALWLYSSNTSFRGMTMRTVAEVEMAAIAESFPGTVRGLKGLRSHLSTLGRAYTEDQWRRIRYNRKLGLARDAGLIDLNSAIQAFERPTYFKEVLAGLSGIMKNDPIYQSYASCELECDNLCKEHDILYSEMDVLFPEIVKLKRKRQLEWFDRQAYIETYAFTLIDGSTRADPKGNLLPVENDSSFESGDAKHRLRSFNTVHMVDRPDKMDRIMRRFLKKQLTVEESLVSFAAHLDNLGEDSLNKIKGGPRELIFIKQSRIVNDCTLSTPLWEKSST
jgi:hypothetical protein